jgi:hypothetical protein
MGLRLTVRETGGNTQVLLRLPGDGDPTPFGPEQPFTPPLTIPDFEDLRFYLEDYAQLPVGEFAVRGERVEREKLAAWGEALFASVFGASTIANADLYIGKREISFPIIAISPDADRRGKCGRGSGRGRPSA